MMQSGAGTPGCFGYNNCGPCYNPMPSCYQPCQPCGGQPYMGQSQSFMGNPCMQPCQQQAAPTWQTPATPRPSASPAPLSSQVVEEARVEAPQPKTSSQFLKVKRKVIEYEDEVVEEMVPVKSIVYEERKSVRKVPVQKKVQDYYMIETITQFKPQAKEKATVVPVPVTKTVKVPQYTPVEKEVVHFSEGLFEEISKGNIILEPEVLERFKRAETGDLLRQKEIIQIERNSTRIPGHCLASRTLLPRPCQAALLQHPRQLRQLHSGPGQGHSRFGSQRTAQQWPGGLVPGQQEYDQWLGPTFRQYCPEPVYWGCSERDWILPAAASTAQHFDGGRVFQPGRAAAGRLVQLCAGDSVRGEPGCGGRAESRPRRIQPVRGTDTANVEHAKDEGRRGLHSDVAHQLKQIHVGMDSSAVRDAQGEVPRLRFGGGPASRSRGVLQKELQLGLRAGPRLKQDSYSERWAELCTFGDLPKPSNGHTVVLYGDCLFLFGGFIVPQQPPSDKVYRLHLPSARWTLLKIEDLPGPCNLHSTTLVGKTIYLFKGGDGQSYYNRLFLFDPVVENWSVPPVQLGRPPSPRANHSAAGWANKLFIHGGWNGKEYLGDMFLWSINEHTWYEVRTEQLPGPICGAATTVSEGKLYLFGGINATSRSSLLFSFDLLSFSWSQILPRSGHTMHVVGGRLLVLGGQVHPKVPLCGLEQFALPGNGRNGRQEHDLLVSALSRLASEEEQFIVQLSDGTVTCNPLLMSIFSSFFKQLLSRGERRVALDCNKSTFLHLKRLSSKKDLQFLDELTQEELRELRRIADYLMVEVLAGELRVRLGE